MDDRIRINAFFFLPDATSSEAAVGLKLQPQCKKLSDSNGVFFNRTAKKGFSIQELKSLMALLIKQERYLVNMECIVQSWNC